MVRPPWHPPQPSSQEVVGALGYNQELGLCIEFGPVRDDSVHWGGGPAPVHAVMDFYQGYL